MRPIDKFILHVVHNLYPLNEYSSAEITRLISQFRDEADDLGITISEDELRRAIERFDVIKNGLEATDRDLRTYTIKQLLRVVRKSPGMEVEEDTDHPDIVYDEDDLIIYSGHNENNCITYGQGERWCITRTSFGTYRYDVNKKNPTFYLVKDNTLPNTDNKSFFVVVVGSDRTYKVSDRSNNGDSEWDTWRNWAYVSQHYPRIAGLERLFKYIPITSTEMGQRVWGNTALSLNAWATDLNFNDKKNYITIRNTKTELFSNMSREMFVVKVLPKYDKLAEWASQNPKEIGFIYMLKGIESFKPSYQRSILVKINSPGFENTIKSEQMIDETIPFIVKAATVKMNRLSGQKVHLADNEKTIVWLDYDNDYEKIEINLIKGDDYYSNVKITERTQKYLFESPYINEISLTALIKFVKDNNLNAQVLSPILNQLKTSETITTRKVIDIGGNDILFDASKELSIYKLGEELDLVDVKEEGILDAILPELATNLHFQKAVMRECLTDNNGKYDYQDLSKLMLAIPKPRRVLADGREIVVPINGMGVYLFYSAKDTFRAKIVFDADHENGGESILFNSNICRVYSAYLRQKEDPFTANELLSLFRDNTNTPYITKTAFVLSNPPLSADNDYKLIMVGSTIVLANKLRLSNSYKVSPTTGGLLRTTAPASTLTATTPQIPAELLPDDEPEPTYGRRGRPAVAPTPGRRGRPSRHAPRPAPQPEVGNINIEERFRAHGLAWNSMGYRLRTQFFSGLGVGLPNYGNRGASRRDNMLGRLGSVFESIAKGNSTVYFIRLRSGRIVASLVAQPGNSHYLVTNDSVFDMNSPSDLLHVLDEHGLDEKKSGNKLSDLEIFMVKYYVALHPDEKPTIAKAVNKITGK